MRNEAFQSILDNYNALLELWETILNDKPDSETRSQVNGIDSQMKTFDFYFGASLLHNVLSHADNLSKTLQHTRLNAAEGQHLVRMTTTSYLKVHQNRRNIQAILAENHHASQRIRNCRANFT